MEVETEIKHETIEGLITNGYKLRIGYYIKTAFKIYRKYFWGFVGFTAIMIFVSLALSSIFVMPPVSSMFSITIQTHLNPFVEYLVYMPISSIILFFLVTGYFIVARKIHLNQTLSFDNFFDGIKHWKQLLFASLIVYIVLLLFSISLIGI